MKKWLFLPWTIIIIFFTIAGISYFAWEGRQAQIDCFGVVQAVRAEGDTVYLTVEGDFNIVYELTVPKRTVCRDRFDGSKLKAAEIREGWRVSCDFKGKSTSSNGINYATAKGPIVVYRTAE